MLTKNPCDCCRELVDNRFIYNPEPNKIFLVCSNCNEILTSDMKKVEQNLHIKEYHDYYHEIARKKYEMYKRCFPNR